MRIAPVITNLSFDELLLRNLNRPVVIFKTLGLLSQFSISLQVQMIAADQFFP